MTTTARTTRRLAAALSAGVVALAVAGTAGPATAARSGSAASGNTTIQLNASTLKGLQAHGCGPLAATPTGSGRVAVTGAGKVKVTLPVTGYVAADTGAQRIEHAGSGVELSNACYDVRLTNFYVQDLGGLQKTAFFEVLAKTISADEDGGRQLAFLLDVTPATGVVIARPSATTIKIKGMDLTLGNAGAAELNQLATGDESVGPFSAGQQVGKGRTSIRLAR